MNLNKIDNYYKTKLSQLLILLFATFSCSLVFSNQTLVLNSTLGHPFSNEAQTGFLDHVLAEAFRRIDYNLETVRVPAERALIFSSRGIVDGELSRIAGLQKKYPNLIQIPEQVTTVNFVLFSINYPDFEVKAWDSVASHSVGIITGWKIMEDNFGKYKDKIEITTTDNVGQLFTLLVKDRVDFIAYTKWAGLAQVKKSKLNKIKLLHPPLASMGSYVYLHKKHIKIVPKLSAAIKAMKGDGTIKLLYDKILKPYQKLQ